MKFIFKTFLLISMLVFFSGCASDLEDAINDAIGGGGTGGGIEDAVNDGLTQLTIGSNAASTMDRWEYIDVGTANPNARTTWNIYLSRTDGGEYGEIEIFSLMPNSSILTIDAIDGDLTIVDSASFTLANNGGDLIVGNTLPLYKFVVVNSKSKYSASSNWVTSSKKDTNYIVDKTAATMRFIEVTEDTSATITTYKLGQASMDDAISSTTTKNYTKR